MRVESRAQREACLKIAEAEPAATLVVQRLLSPLPPNTLKPNEAYLVRIVINQLYTFQSLEVTIEREG